MGWEPEHILGGGVGCPHVGTFDEDSPMKMLGRST